VRTDSQEKVKGIRNKLRITRRTKRSERGEFLKNPSLCAEKTEDKGRVRVAPGEGLLPSKENVVGGSRKQKGVLLDEVGVTQWITSVGRKER